MASTVRDHRGRSGRGRILARLLLIFNLALATALIFGLFAGVAVYQSLKDVLPDADDIAAIYTQEATTVFSSDGHMLGKVFQQYREPVRLDEIPKKLVQATIAVEDDRFYQHAGFDLRGMARAALANVRSGSASQGGSTITQQLARNLYLTQKKTVSRKLQELALSVQMERRFTKEEILEAYLNQIYYGSGAYGIRTAASIYFGKPLEKLTLAEMATLAGLPRWPAGYNPFEHADRAQQRRGVVLQRMKDLGYITAAEATAAAKEPLRLVKNPKIPGSESYEAPYFTNQVLRELVERYGADVVYKTGLRVYTTVNYEMQAAAEKAVREAVRTQQFRKVEQGALVSLDPRTGAIMALVGGVDWLKSKFNRAVQARRQPGSAFKVFVYTAAVDHGLRPFDVIEDAPISFPGSRRGQKWSPHNYDGKYHGKVFVRDALRHSYNTAAVRIAQRFGIETIIDYARRMGIESPLEAVLPVALGANGITPMEMATALTSIANGGIRVDPHYIDRIEDRAGNVIFQHRSQSHRVLSPETADTITAMMIDVVEHGTGVSARIPGYRIAGKTGTTNDYNNAWFVGFTAQLVTVTWYGRDDNTPMAPGSQGARVAAPSWKQLMAAALGVLNKGVPPDQIPQLTAQLGPPPARPDVVAPAPSGEAPDGSIPGAIPAAATEAGDEIQICRDTGLIATPTCPDTVWIPADSPNAPTKTCALHARPKPGERLILVTVCSDTGQLATRNCPGRVRRQYPVALVPKVYCRKHPDDE